MSKTTESNMNEMINSAGDGSGLQLPPAFVMVNPRQHRKYKKNNETVGVLGVIGPKRMDYERIVEIVDFTAKMFSKN